MSSNLNGSSFFYKNGMDRKAMGSRPISPPLIFSSFLFLNINISKKSHNQASSLAHSPNSWYSNSILSIKCEF